AKGMPTPELSLYGSARASTFVRKQVHPGFYEGISPRRFVAGIVEGSGAFCPAGRPSFHTVLRVLPGEKARQPTDVSRHDEGFT
ncbi:MAG TPA: hypothetical protein VGL77_10165, partial [Armatimonadota bacterium]